MIEKRYFVRLVRGIAMGAGMYAVFDGYEGRQIGEPTCWRDDAEMTANRLNAGHLASENANV